MFRLPVVAALAVLSRQPAAGPSRAILPESRPFAEEVAEDIGLRLRDSGRFQASSGVFRSLISRHPTSKRVCVWQLRVVHNVESAERFEAQIEELLRLGTLSDQMAARGGGSNEAAACRAGLHDELEALAFMHHREDTTGCVAYSWGNWSGIERLYRELLRRFPRDADTYDVRFYLAELLSTEEKWQEAAEQYALVWVMNPPGRHARQAAYGLLLAGRNALGLEEIRVGPGRSSLELPGPERRATPAAPS